MSNNAQIVFTSQPLPEGFCAINEQDRFNTYAAFLSGYLPGNFSSFNLGTAQPTVDNQDKPWIKLNTDGSIEGLYTFSSGAWVRPYPVPAGPNEVRWLWAGDLANLITFDGGAAGAVSDVTGPFWEQDTDWTDRIPIGVGALAPAVNTDYAKLTSGVSANPKVRGVYFIKRTARKFIVG